MGDVLRRTTVPFAYVRLIGVHDALDTFDVVRIPRERELAWWAKAIGEAMPRLERVFGVREQSLSRPQPRNGPRTSTKHWASRTSAPKRITQPTLF